MQKNKIIQCLKTLVRRLLWCMAGVLILYFSAFYFLPTSDVGDCEQYTERLNGGVHSVGGRFYRVTLCGEWMRNPAGDPIRLQVHSIEGELLAERWFTVQWDGGFSSEIEYKEDGLVYFDQNDEDDFKKMLNMPPTWLDWLRARIP